MRARAPSIALAVTLAGCASNTVLTKQLADYISHHQPPLSSAEIDRLYGREVRVGDPLDRVQAAWSGTTLQLSRTDGVTAIWDGHVSWGEKPVRVGPAPEGGKPAEVIGQNGDVILTFERKVLKAYVVLAPGVK